MLVKSLSDKCPIKIRMIRHLSIILLFCLSFPLFADIGSLYVITSDDSKKYNTLAKAVTAQIQKNCATDCFSKMQIISAADSATQTFTADDFVVTLGLNAYLQSHGGKRADKPPKYLHALLPRQSIKADANKDYFLWLDQPLQRQLKIIDNLLTDKVRVFIFYTSDSQWRIDEFTPEKTAHIEPVFQKIKPEEIGSILNSPELENQFVLMLPDKKIYNRYNLKQTLLTGYLNRIAFIGYSKSLSRSGAAFSIVTNIQTYLEEISNKVIRIKKAALPELQAYPDHYRLIINSGITQSQALELNLSDINADNIEVLSE